MLGIYVNVEKYMMKCELGKSIEMGIMTRGYYPHLTGYGYVNILKPEVRVQVRVWARNNEMGKGLGDHYPHPNPAGAMLITDVLIAIHACIKYMHWSIFC